MAAPALSSPLTIGFIGLGTMGRSMVMRLLQAGQIVVAHNRTRRDDQQPLVEAGMRWADSPSAVAAVSSILFVCVTNSDAAQAVALGENGYLSNLGSPHPCTVVCDVSTISPSMSASIGSRVRDKAGASCAYLDAPFSGSHISVQQYKGAFMVGGDAEAFQVAQPVLMHIAPRATHVGGSGKALCMKIAVNLNLSAQMIAFSESVLLAERSGIPKEVAVEVLCNCAISSPMIQYRGPLVLQEQEAFFNLAMMRKDLRLALEMGSHLGVPLPTTLIGEQLHTAGIGMGFEHSDFGPGMYKVLSAMSNAVEDRLAPPGFVDKVVMVPRTSEVPQTVRVPVAHSSGCN